MYQGDCQEQAQHGLHHPAVPADHRRSRLARARHLPQLRRSSSSCSSGRCCTRSSSTSSRAARRSAWRARSRSRRPTIRGCGTSSRTSRSRPGPRCRRSTSSTTRRPTPSPPGVTRSTPSVAATTGLLDIMNDAELEGVMAHELGHVRNYDIRLSMIVFGLTVAVGFIADMFLRMAFFGGGAATTTTTAAGAATRSSSSSAWSPRSSRRSSRRSCSSPSRASANTWRMRPAR